MERIDRRQIIGFGLIAASLAVLGVALAFIVASATGGGVELPSEGSLNEIAGENPGGYVIDVTSGEQEPLAQGPLPVRVIMPNIGVDAPVIILGLDADSIPEVPGRGDQVAWYNFSSTPGRSDNAVFSGHVDWQTAGGDPIPGAFYRLRELHIGDEINIALEDGSLLKYQVTGNVAAQYDDPNIVRSMGPTSRDVITLITCGGTWLPNPSEHNGGNYSHRIVVRAELVTPAAANAFADS